MKFPFAAISEATLLKGEVCDAKIPSIEDKLVFANFVVCNHIWTIPELRYQSFLQAVVSHRKTLPENRKESAPCPPVNVSFPSLPERMSLPFVTQEYVITHPSIQNVLPVAPLQLITTFFTQKNRCLPEKLNHSALSSAEVLNETESRRKLSLSALDGWR